ncbi:SGNH/GDSL hydrolase family protein [Delftia acidovorans]|uniref:SGNH/GDSL hydrolase family protein n=1 Tax=Delftia acidovorans TaxID=80866 RepID=UPI0024327898|nr:SGNH/GDSL hydrolase family protein [Delftia acidovorans]
MVKKIAVIGDSISAQQGIYDVPWPVLLQSSMQSGGEPVEVTDLSNNGYTFRSAMEQPTYGSMTPAQRCVQESPDMVIVALGINDFFQQSGNSIEVVKAHAKSLFDFLRAQLPGAVILYASETPYDKVHGSPASLLNRHFLPAFFNNNASGLLNQLYCTENLANPVASNHRSAMTSWLALDGYIRSLSNVNGSFDLPLWPCCRLGLVGTDGLHPTHVGHRFLHAAARKAMEDLSAAKTLFPRLGSQGDNSWNSWQKLFEGLLQDNGTEYVAKQPNVGDLHAMQYFGPWVAEVCEMWFLPTHGTLNTSATNYIRGNSQVWSVTGAAPKASVYSSINNAAWVQHSRLTDSRGNYLDAGSLDGLPDGTHTIRYRVANEVFPSVNVTISGTSSAKADGSNALGIWPIKIDGPSAMVRQGFFSSRSMPNGRIIPAAARFPLELGTPWAQGLLESASISTEGRVFNGCRLKSSTNSSCWIRANARATITANSDGRLIWLGLFVADATGALKNTMVIGGGYSSPRPTELASVAGEAVVSLLPGYTVSPWIYVVGGASTVSDGVDGNFWEFSANLVY